MTKFIGDVPIAGFVAGAVSHGGCDRAHSLLKAQAFSAARVACLFFSFVIGAWICRKTKRTQLINNARSSPCADVAIQAMFSLKAFAVSILNTRDKEAQLLQANQAPDASLCAA
jgi:hypothetical protein